MRFLAKLVQKFLFFAFLGLTVFGGRSVWVSLRYRQPLQVELASLAVGTNQAAWITVRNCEYTALDAVGWTNRLIQSFQEVLIPARVDAHDTNSVMPLLIVTRDRGILDGLNALQRKDGLVAKLSILAEKPELMFVKRDVTGLVRSRLEIGEEELRAYRSAFPSLTENFVLLDEGKSPSVLKGIVMLGFGVFFLLLAAGLGLLLEKRSAHSNKTPPIIPPPLPSAQPRNR